WRRGIVQLQAHCRGAIARSVLETRQRSAIRIQADFRGMLVRRGFRVVRLCVSRLQAAYRMVCAKMYYRRVRTALISLQRFCATRLAHRQFRRLLIAIRRIQTLMRTVLLSHLRERRCRRAAHRIQRLWAGCKCRQLARQARLAFDRQCTAARILQAFIRRRHRRRRHAAARRLQDVSRIKILRPKLSFTMSVLDGMLCPQP
ncbi:unnamed protein product, partial [Amoebophrya sp. A120]